MAPLTKFAAQEKRFNALHAIYGLLFSQVEAVITRIRREHLHAENLGASKQVQDSFRQTHALDEEQPDQSLDREDKKVRERFPSDYLWQM